MGRRKDGLTELLDLASKLPFVLGLRAISEVSTYGGDVMDIVGNHR
jgi:hypothetical protein